MVQCVCTILPLARSTLMMKLRNNVILSPVLWRMTKIIFVCKVILIEIISRISWVFETCMLEFIILQHYVFFKQIYLPTK